VQSAFSLPPLFLFLFLCSLLIFIYVHLYLPLFLDLPRPFKRKSDRNGKRGNVRARSFARRERQSAWSRLWRIISSSVTSAYLINMCIKVVAWRVFRAIIELTNDTTFNW